MVVPPKHPKMIIFSRKTHGFVGYHHFRKHPYNGCKNFNFLISIQDREALLQSLQFLQDTSIADVREMDETPYIWTKTI